MDTINNYTKPQAMDKAFKTAFEGETNRFCCSQETFHAVSSILGFKNQLLFKFLSAFEGGSAIMTTGNCGAFSAGLAVFSYFFGRSYELWEKKEMDCKSSYLGQELYKRFQDEHGSIICKDILKNIFGRTFDFNKEDELACYEEMGGHAFVCPTICGLSAAWTIDLIWDEIPKDIDLAGIPDRSDALQKLRKMRQAD